MQVTAPHLYVDPTGPSPGPRNPGLGAATGMAGTRTRTDELGLVAHMQSRYTSGALLTA